MPPISRIQVSLLPITSKVRELDAGRLETHLRANANIMMELLKVRMQKYPADLRNTPRGMTTNNLEGRSGHQPTMRFRGESLRSYRTRAYSMYHRTFVLRESWHVAERGFIVQLYNNAREAGRRGRGRPYAIFVYGSGDGQYPQAAQHLGRWPSLFDEFQKIKGEFAVGAQNAVDAWVAEQMG